MQQKIAVIWLGVMIVLILDMLVSPGRWFWTGCAIVGATAIYGYLFQKAEEFDQRQQDRQNRNWRK